MDAKSQRQSLLQSFAIHDRESCARAIRNGGIAAMVSAALSSAFGIAGFFTSSSNKDLNYLLDPWILADVALVVILGILVFRKSRVAATLLVVYFVAAKGLMWYELGKLSGVLMAIIFLLYYFTAMRGTYLWHSRYRDSAGTAA